MKLRQTKPVEFDLKKLTRISSVLTSGQLIGICVKAIFSKIIKKDCSSRFISGRVLLVSFFFLLARWEISTRSGRWTFCVFFFFLSFQAAAISLAFRYLAAALATCFVINNVVNWTGNTPGLHLPCSLPKRNKSITTDQWDFLFLKQISPPKLLWKGKKQILKMQLQLGKNRTKSVDSSASLTRMNETQVTGEEKAAPVWATLPKLDTK